MAIGRGAGSRRLPGGLWRGSWAAPWAVLPLAAPGAQFGSPGISFWSFFGSGKPFLSAFLQQQAWSAKKGPNFNKKLYFRVACLACFLCYFLRLAGGAGARAHLEKTGFRLEGIAFFACRPLARGAQKRRHDDEKLGNHSLKTHRKRNAKSHAKKHQQMSEHGPKWLPKSLQNPSGEPLGHQVGRRRVPTSARKAPGRSETRL